MVELRVLQNAGEQQRQFRRRPVRIRGGELHHRFLHDVERGVLVADRELGLLERAPFDAGQEFGELFWRGHRMALIATRRKQVTRTLRIKAADAIRGRAERCGPLGFALGGAVQYC